MVLATLYKHLIHNKLANTLWRHAALRSTFAILRRSSVILSVAKNLRIGSI